MPGPIRKIKIYKNLFLGYILFLLILASFILGFFLGNSEKVKFLSKYRKSDFFLEKEENLNLFKEIYRILERKYVDKSLLASEELLYGSIKGMVEALNDPYTLFMTPKEMKEFKKEMEGTFEGIGAEIGIKKKMLTIIAPLEDSPAEKAGLLPGDLILKIDQKKTQNLSLEEAIRLIRGEKGTKVVLSIFREGLSETKEFSIIRDEIKVKSVACQIKEKNIAYFRLIRFSEETEDEFSDCLEQMQIQGFKKIILDLRNNPGGYLQSSIDISSFFLKKNSLIVLEEFSSGKREEFRTQKDGELVNSPLIVLINQGSASGSEIIAGALKDNKRGILLGEKTFGKGSVQELTSLSKGGGLRFTVAKWLTPEGRYINETGVTPDQEVKMTLEDWENKRDPQLEEALKISK